MSEGIIAENASQKRQLADGDEQTQPEEGLRILARIIARHASDHPELYAEAVAEEGDTQARNSHDTADGASIREDAAA